MDILGMCRIGPADVPQMIVWPHFPCPADMQSWGHLAQRNLAHRTSRSLHTLAYRVCTVTHVTYRPFCELSVCGMTFPINLYQSEITKGFAIIFKKYLCSEILCFAFATFTIALAYSTVADMSSFFLFFFFLFLRENNHLSIVFMRHSTVAVELKLLFCSLLRFFFSIWNVIVTSLLL